jgi:hypothetical protein
MIKSYEKVNYLLRLKKQIERKLIIETFQHLDSIIDIKNYHYFGFGSIYFADFIMFHKYLNIHKMTSIDNKPDDEKRFLYNKPFGFINFRLIDCREFLERELDWAHNLFIWLDFDTAIDKSIIDIIEYVSAKSKSLDIFLITTEGESPDKPENCQNFIDTFREYVPADLIAKAVKEDFPKTLNSIVKTSIRNGLNRQMGNLEFLQIFNLVYEDTKKMYTFGAIFCNNDAPNKIRSKLTGLTYIKHDNNIAEIDCPLITPREKMCLDACIKKEGMDDLYTKTGLTKEIVDKYRSYYKYYPQFFESIY